MTVSSVLQPVLMASAQSVLGNGAGAYVPPETSIDAPTNVTYVDGTNPPLFSMNYSDTGPGAVLVGDVLQKRYASAPGTVYDSDPITEIPVLQPVEFSDPVQADGTIDEGQLRWSRTGGIYSEWSNVAEPGSGAYAIGDVDVTDPVFTSPTTGNVDEGDTLSFNVTTDEATTKTIIGGAQQADFELVSGATPATTHVLRWASNGTETAGAFEVQIEAEDAAGNTATQTITITCDAPASYETESEAIFAAFTTPPDTPHKDAINDFVVALKTASIWSKFDFIYGLAAADNQAARVNWVDPGTYDATVVGSPTFVADRGYTGAASGYLNTGFSPINSPSPKFTQNDASMFIWALTGGSATGTLSSEIGSFYSFVGKDFGAGDSIARVNRNAAEQPMTTTGFPGSVGWSRSASNVWEAYANGVDAGGGTDTTIGLDSANFRILNANGHNDGLLQIAFAMAGSNLTSGEVAALHDAMNDYLVAVGAI